MRKVATGLVFLATAGHCEAMAGARDFIARHIVARGNGQDEKLDVAAFVALDISSRSRRLGLFYLSLIHI